jgi:hypothetical protein
MSISRNISIARFLGIAACLGFGASGLVAQPRDTRPTPEPPVATEVLRIRPSYVMAGGIGHGYGRLLARAEVLSAARSASGLRRGSSIIIIFAFTGFRFGAPMPLVKGQIYRASLVRDPRATTENGERIYDPVNGFKIFQLLKHK